jgi:hypothetical protein
MVRDRPATVPPRWVAPAGIATFIALMSAGYAYNVTFVQLGVTDLGRRLLGLSDERVAGAMALLAIVTAAVAIGVGVWMGRAGVGRDLRRKLRIAAVVVACQTALTLLAPHVPSPEAFTVWVFATAVALGVGVPVTFALTVDLVPVRRRGAVAGAVTAVAYAFAPLASGDWTIEPLATMFGPAMVAGTIVLAALGWVDLPFVRHLARQHAAPAFGRGRYVRGDGAGRRRLVGALVLLFVVFFVDSLGFLRLVDTPLYVAETWRSVEMGPRLAIAVAHVVAAAIGGLLYGALGERALLRGCWARSPSCTSGTRSTPAWAWATVRRWRSRCCTPSRSASTPSWPSRSGPTSRPPTRSACTRPSGSPPPPGPRPSSRPRSPSAGPRPAWRSSGTWRWSTA